MTFPANVIPFTRSLTLASSFGLSATTLGPQFRARQIVESERNRLLDRRQAYYTCTHHDWKQHDFDGRMMPQGNPLLGQPLLSSAPSDWYVPLKMRRPSSPYRLARVIVESFTGLVFGHQRWPTVGCPGDKNTEEFARAIVDATSLRTQMIRARNIGGSVGTVGLSWRIWGGKPRVRVHNGKQLVVHSWADRELLIPAHVSEIYRFPRDEFDPVQGKWTQNWYWYRHDWTEIADVAFKEVRYDQAQDPQWEIDEENSYVHGDGYAHFVWIANLPSDNPEDIDGIPDYEGLYENFEAIDLMNSVLVRGTTLNLDPTLVLKMDPDIVNRMGISKGSENSLVVGVGGDASYMELQGSSVQAGTGLFTKMRDSALEVAQCVVPDPNQIGAAGSSSVAMKVIYAPMLGKADLLREQYERALQELLRQIVNSARSILESVEVVIDDDGNEEEQGFYLDLPPKLEQQEVLGPDGTPTGEMRTVEVDLQPGAGRYFTFDWGDYFMPTAADQQQTSATLVQYSTAKLISQESAADLASRSMRIDARADWQRLQQEKTTQAQASEGMFDMGGGMGGKVGADDELPPDALPRDPKEQWHRGDEGAPVEQAWAGSVTVNQARAAMGLPLLEGPDGDLTIAAYNAKLQHG